MISVFGSNGFIGNRFQKKFESKCISISRNSLKAESDEILYFISTTHNYNILDNPYIDIDTNLTHLIKVLEYNKNKIKTFNFVSSWFVYGDSDLPAKENSPCNPKGFYSITKKCAEDLLISYCKTYNINYKIYRLCNIYGDTDKNASAKKNALQFLINKLKNHEEINLYENGNFIRDYMHVDDVCDAINLCIDSMQPNEIINISNGIPLVFREIIDHVVNQTQSKSKINSIEIPNFHKIVQVRDMYLDNTKLKNLGFISKVSINDGLNKLI